MSQGSKNPLWHLTGRIFKLGVNELLWKTPERAIIEVLFSIFQDKTYKILSRKWFFLDLNTFEHFSQSKWQQNHWVPINRKPITSSTLAMSAERTPVAQANTAPNMPRRRIGSGSDSDNNNDGKALKPKMLLRTIQPKGRLRRHDPSTESETDYADKPERSILRAKPRLWQIEKFV